MDGWMERGREGGRKAGMCWSVGPPPQTIHLATNYKNLLTHLFYWTELKTPQDISADEAHQLHSLLTVLLERSPEMFREDEPTEASKVSNETSSMQTGLVG